MEKQKKITSNFIYKIIHKDLFINKYKYIHTRFPPEPNGYLHLGHAKSICLNFNLAKIFKGKCNLRFDDTNPNTKHEKYINKIKNDILWLGFKWDGKTRYSSDYFDQIYNFAIKLIKKNLAYVEELSLKEVRKNRGSLTRKGKQSPYRNRKIKENLILFEKMKNGEFKEGSACLRAKINMQSSCVLMRDPILYRIRFKNHHRTKNKWCIYPTYDFSHCISDSIENITHSLCTLEFQENKKLYNWILKKVSTDFVPKQYEFSRMNLEYSIMSKRKLKILIEKKLVSGWNDPRIPTLAGIRRRGYTASSIREFCNRIGITKQESTISESMLEFFIKKELNFNSYRLMAVINPLLLIIENFPDEYEEKIEISNHPYNNMGKRTVIFNKKIYIERSDFMENPKLEYKRLSLGKKVKLRNSYIIKANRIEKNKHGYITKVYCNYYSNIKKNNYKFSKLGIIHWVSEKNNIPAEFRFYDRLFTHPNPEKLDNFLSFFNKDSLIIKHGFIEKNIKKHHINYPVQFERIGYFFADKFNYKKDYPVFNLTAKLSSYLNR
ncbi:glnS [Wigglesworthia glossinidia endosymbiont of Glossina brevipalpis]|uniref:Glutamine--tRNA ligase n=1 Tax=Wigglesworthia glossinidia brevipalpis TaxID=36870 RepID=Q8D2R6_WIGBR|nr:glnS [Wigglesworthia glossinidia endosymbiont of Glossina brevipalpis]